MVGDVLLPDVEQLPEQLVGGDLISWVQGGFHSSLDSKNRTRLIALGVALLLLCYIGHDRCDRMRHERIVDITTRITARDLRAVPMDEIDLDDMDEDDIELSEFPPDWTASKIDRFVRLQKRRLAQRSGSAPNSEVALRAHSAH